MIKYNKKLNSSMDYTWEINAKDFQFGTQRGYITPADIDTFVKDLMDTYECTITHPTKDTWYITDLSFTDYEDLERNYWKEVGYYISAKSENVNNSNSATDASDNVTFTLSRFDWRLIYTCAAHYLNRLTFESGYYKKLERCIKTIERKLQGSWKSLRVNWDESGAKFRNHLSDPDYGPDFDEEYLTDEDKQSVTMTFPVLESELLYQAVYTMGDILEEQFMFSPEDNTECYDILKYMQGQLQMTEDEIFTVVFDSTDVNSSKRGAKMIKRAKNLNSAVNGTFNEKAFDHYVRSLVEDCVEYASDHGDPVQIIEHMYPGYNWEWACEGTDPAWDKLRKDLQNALYNYIKYQYLAYKE